MTKNEINRKLAIDVMGWEMVAYHITNTRWWKKDCGSHITLPTWNPWENIEQAFEVLEKFFDWNVCYNSYLLRYECKVRKNTGYEYEGFGKTPQEAICRAAIKAVKEDE